MKHLCYSNWKLLLINFILLLLIMGCGSQPVGFVKNYGGDHQDHGLAIAKMYLENDGYMVCGGKKTDDGTPQAWVLRIDKKKGDIVWEKTIEGALWARDIVMIPPQGRPNAVAAGLYAIATTVEIPQEEREKDGFVFMSRYPGFEILMPDQDGKSITSKEFKIGIPESEPYGNSIRKLEVGEKEIIKQGGASSEAMIQLQNGGFILVGNTSFPNSRSSGWMLNLRKDKTMRLIKSSKVGMTACWTNNYFPGSKCYDDYKTVSFFKDELWTNRIHYSDIVNANPGPNNEDGFVVTGYKVIDDPTDTEPDEGQYLFVGKYKEFSNGPVEGITSVWEKERTFYHNGTCVGQAVERAKNGGYIIAGYARENNKQMGMIAFVDEENGDLVGDMKFFDEGGNISEFTSVKQAPGGYILTGFASTSELGVTNLWILKLKEDGEKDWSETYFSKEHNSGEDIIPIEDGYILTGSLGSQAKDPPGQPAYEPSDLLIMKTDSEGKK